MLFTTTLFLKDIEPSICPHHHHHPNCHHCHPILSFSPLIDKCCWKQVTVGQKLLVDAKIMKMVKEEQASLHQACQHFNIDKSQYHYWTSNLEEWLETLRRSFFGSETPISGGKQRKMLSTLTTLSMLFSAIFLKQEELCCRSQFEHFASKHVNLTDVSSLKLCRLRWEKVLNIKRVIIYFG